MVWVRPVDVISCARAYGIFHWAIGMLVMLVLVLVGLVGCVAAHGMQKFGMSRAAKRIVATNSFDPMSVTLNNEVSRSVSFHPPVSAVADEWLTLSKDGAEFEPHSI